MISVGIVGASGYTGEELVKLLQQHSEVQILSLTSRTHSGVKINKIFSLEKPLEGTFKEPSFDNLKDCDLVFFATPNGVAMNMAAELVRNNIRIIDISADFRLTDVKQWEQWYDKKHSSPSLVSESVYGLPEIPGQKEKIKNAKIVANPGCYPTSSILALLPLCELLDEQKIIIDAKSGISGAGRNLNNKKLFPEGEDNFQAYAVGKHRHYPEILQILNLYNSKLDVIFVPHLSSMIRGIFSTHYLKLDNNNTSTLIETYKAFYKDSSFVEIIEDDSFPKVSDVTCTNKCRISLHEIPNATNDMNLVIFSVIDNLIKGASGQAIQNMNIMYGFDEETSLI